MPSCDCCKLIVYSLKEELLNYQSYQLDHGGVYK